MSAATYVSTTVSIFGLRQRSVDSPHRLPRRVSSIRKNGLTSDPASRSAQERHNGSDICNLRQTTLHRHGLVERNSVVGFLRVEECCGLSFIVSNDRQYIRTGHKRDVRVSMGPGPIALTLMRRPESSLATPRVKCSTGALEPAYEV